MIVIAAPKDAEPATKVRCDCNAQFWVDPCGEENLVMKDGVLTPQCPLCKKIEAIRAG